MDAEPPASSEPLLHITNGQVVHGQMEIEFPRQRSFRDLDASGMMHQWLSYESGPLLSVVISSYDPRRFGDVRDLVDSLEKQSYREIEVLFVTESLVLKSMIEEYVESSRAPNIRVICNSTIRGVNACRNEGIEKAHGEIIAILDDDVVVNPDWAEEIVKTFNRFVNVGAVTGPADPLWTGGRQEWIPRQLYWLISCTIWDWTKVTEIRNVGGMNSAYLAYALHHAGLFDESIGPRGGGAKAGRVFYVGAEEVELSLRVRETTGMKILYNPSIRVQHKVHAYHASLRSLTARALHFGYTRGYISHLPRINKHNSPLSFEVSQLPMILINVFNRSRTSRLNLSEHGKRMILYLVSFLSVSLGYLIHFVNRGT